MCQWVAKIPEQNTQIFREQPSTHLPYHSYFESCHIYSEKDMFCLRVLTCLSLLSLCNLNIILELHHMFSRLGHQNLKTEHRRGPSPQ